MSLTWPDFISLLNTVSLLVVVAGCVGHIFYGQDRNTPLCGRLGFALTAGGAAGVAAYRWWPKIESFPFPTLLYIGACFIALSVMRGDFRAWINERPKQSKFEGVERRQLL